MAHPLPVPDSPMPLSFRAIAIDYDGTLATGRPDDDVLDAIAEIRKRGIRVILCTGRILDDLRSLVPWVEERFDAVVAENGAVIATEAAGVRDLASPIPAELEEALRRRNVPLRRGRVLLDTYAEYDHAVLEEMASQGLDCQIVRNRHALMVLPAGVTKGSGLIEVLGDLCISRHSTIGIGDAENDHALLEACELGVAVGNAVPSLRAHADIVLAEPNGRGVAGFLRGPVLRDEIPVRPGHWRIEIGHYADGAPASVPASGVNVLVHGEPGTGKSWLAGLLAERLIEAGYSVCILDPEGDYGPLGRLRGALVTDARHPPEPALLGRLIRHRFSSVIVDLSRASQPEKRTYYREVDRRLRQLRSESGLPHWIFLDEADQLLEGDDPLHDDGRTEHGYCLITHRPDAINPTALEAIDVRISRDDERLAEDARTAADGRTDARDLRERPVTALVDVDGRTSVFTASPRICPHLRHWHKYLRHGVPADRRFHFRTAQDTTGRSAGNLAEFHRELRNAEARAAQHHFDQADFSRWIREVLREERLAASVRNVEERFRKDRDTEAARISVLDAIRLLYGDPASHRETLGPDAS